MTAAVTLDNVVAAVEQVESGGAWWAKSSAGCIGVMQICPQWAHVPRTWLWHPEINRQEGRRLLTYWHRKARGNWAFALAAYNCGWAGLKGQCGVGYARLVLSKARKLEEPT